MGYSVHESELERLVSERPGRERVFFVSRERAGTDDFLAGVLTYQPGVRSPYHFHQGCEHFQLVLEGKGVVVTEKGEFPVGPGTLVFIHEGDRHQMRAEGGTLRFLEFQVPNRFQTVILEGGDVDLRWFHTDGRVWKQS
ncbi:MAG: cupin domain-containing protein [Nitrospinota bacterium]